MLLNVQVEQNVHITKIITELFAFHLVNMLKVAYGESVTSRAGIARFRRIGRESQSKTKREAADLARYICDRNRNGHRLII